MSTADRRLAYFVYCEHGACEAFVDALRAHPGAGDVVRVRVRDGRELRAALGATTPGTPAVFVWDTAGPDAWVVFNTLRVSDHWRTAVVAFAEGDAVEAAYDASANAVLDGARWRSAPGETAAALAGFWSSVVRFPQAAL